MMTTAESTEEMSWWCLPSKS